MSNEATSGAAVGFGAQDAEGDPKPQTHKQASAVSFEESTRRLTAIVEQLEGGELPLERSLELFEEGVRLARAAKSRLDRAEQRVEELLRVEPDGKPVVRNFEG